MVQGTKTYRKLYKEKYVFGKLMLLTTNSKLISTLESFELVFYMYMCDLCMLFFNIPKLCKNSAFFPIARDLAQFPKTVESTLYPNLKNIFL